MSFRRFDFAAMRRTYSSGVAGVGRDYRRDVLRGLPSASVERRRDNLGGHQSVGGTGNSIAQYAAMRLVREPSPTRELFGAWVRGDGVKPRVARVRNAAR